MSDPNTRVTAIIGRAYWPGDTLPRWRVELACRHKMFTLPAPAPPNIGQPWLCRRCTEGIQP